MENVNQVVETQNQEPVVEGNQTTTLEGIQSNYSKLQSEHEVLRSQYEADKIRFEEERYATPLVKRIDEMIRNGASTQELTKFVSLQSLDLEKMSSEEMIKQKLALEKPGFSAKEIDSLFKRDFKALDEDADEDEREMREITLKEKALEARKYLEDQLATVQDTKAVEAKAKRESEYKAQVQRYETVTNSLMKQMDKVPITLTTDDFKYNLDFPIPQNEELNKGIVSLAVSKAMENRIPASDTEAIKVLVQEIAEMVYHKQRLETVIRDNWANSNRKRVQENSNNMPLPSGSGAPKNPPPPKTERGPVKIKGSTFV